MSQATSQIEEAAQPEASSVGPLADLGRFTLFAYAPTVALLLGLVALARTTGTPIAVLTRDAAVVGEDVPYAGAISNLGAVIWCVAAVTSLLAAALLRRYGHARKWWLFLSAAGALSALLLVDDLFLLHDEILPRYAEIPQKAVLLVYIVLTAAFAWHFRRQILATRFAPLLAGLAFFAASIVVDELFETRDFDVIVLGEALQARNLLE
ncbi:MAG: hypothetical protein ACR2OD_03975, partial [Gaiellaceae bacterium]